MDEMELSSDSEDLVICEDPAKDEEPEEASLLDVLEPTSGREESSKPEKPAILEQTAGPEEPSKPEEHARHKQTTGPEEPSKPEGPAILEQTTGPEELSKPEESAAVLSLEETEDFEELGKPKNFGKPEDNVEVDVDVELLDFNQKEKEEVSEWALPEFTPFTRRIHHGPDPESVGSSGRGRGRGLLGPSEFCSSQSQGFGRGLGRGISTSFSRSDFNYERGTVLKPPPWLSDDPPTPNYPYDIDESYIYDRRSQADKGINPEEWLMGIRSFPTKPRRLEEFQQSIINQNFERRQKPDPQSFGAMKSGIGQDVFGHFHGYNEYGRISESRRMYPAPRNEYGHLVGDIRLSDIKLPPGYGIIKLPTPNDAYNPLHSCPQAAKDVPAPCVSSCSTVESNYCNPNNFQNPLQHYPYPTSLHAPCPSTEPSLDYDDYQGNLKRNDSSAPFRGSKTIGKSKIKKKANQRFNSKNWDPAPLDPRVNRAKTGETVTTARTQTGISQPFPVFQSSLTRPMPERERVLRTSLNNLPPKKPIRQPTIRDKLREQIVNKVVKPGRPFTEAEALHEDKSVSSGEEHASETSSNKDSNSTVSSFTSEKTANDDEPNPRSPKTSRASFVQEKSSPAPAKSGKTAQEEPKAKTNSKKKKRVTTPSPRKVSHKPKGITSKGQARRRVTFMLPMDSSSDDDSLFEVVQNSSRSAPEKPNPPGKPILKAKAKIKRVTPPSRKVSKAAKKSTGRAQSPQLSDQEYVPDVISCGELDEDIQPPKKRSKSGPVTRAQLAGSVPKAPKAPPEPSFASKVNDPDTELRRQRTVDESINRINQQRIGVFETLVDPSLLKIKVEPGSNEMMVKSEIKEEPNADIDYQDVFMSPGEVFPPLNDNSPVANPDTITTQEMRMGPMSLVEVVMGEEEEKEEEQDDNDLDIVIVNTTSLNQMKNPGNKEDE